MAHKIDPRSCKRIYVRLSKELLCVASNYQTLQWSVATDHPSCMEPYLTVTVYVVTLGQTL